MLTACALLGAGPVGSEAQARDTLVVGTYAYDAVDRRGAVTPLAEYLGARLKRPSRVVLAADPVALADAARRGEVDVVVTNTFGYLLLADAAPRAGLAVATFRVPPGVRTHYSAVLVTRDARLRGWAELRARAPHLRVGLVSPGSTTGNLVPRLVLARHGWEERDQQVPSVTYAGTHAGAFGLLRTGAVDVAGLATEEYQRQIAALDAAERARYHVLWESPDILLGPVAVHTGLPAALRDTIRAALVGLERHAPAAFAALRGGWTEARRADGLVAATDATYLPVRRLFGEGAALAALIGRLAR
ncbi:MAG TPA: PhnD/SsuA/transferrin family substrate-binding protein [Gemmatirosa sp.]|nr:PhnD/SsuA/transferrin family substrate-binding protein [Gemmatirosa sp.]